MNLLDHMTDKALIERILDDENASSLDLNLAERLQSALDEMDRLTNPPEEPDGRDA